MVALPGTPYYDPAAPQPGLSVANFGAVGDGVADDSAAISAAITAANGGMVSFPGDKTYRIASTITVSAGTTLFMQGCTLKSGATLANGMFAVSAADVAVVGRYTVNGNALATPIWSLSAGGDRYSHLAAYRITSIAVGTYWLTATGVNNLTVVGPGTTTDSNVIFADQCNHVEIGGFRSGAYTRDLAATFPPIKVTASVNAQYRDWDLHDIAIDGGGAVSNSLIVVNSSVATRPTGVRLRSIYAFNSNAAAGGDGIDVNNVTGFSVSDCYIESCWEGLNVGGSTRGCVSNVNAALCLAPGIEVGDSVYNSQATTGITFVNCRARQCGTSATGLGGANQPPQACIGVFSPAAAAPVSLIRFVNCEGDNAGNASIAYGLGLVNGTGGSISDVTMRSGYLAGNTAAFLDLATPVMQITGVAGITLATNNPAFPASAADFFNTFGLTCLVAIQPGSATVGNVAVNGVVVDTSVVGSGSDLVLAHGDKLNIVYSVATPVWRWVALRI